MVKVITKEKKKKENWVEFVKLKRAYSEPTRHLKVCVKHFINKNYTNRFAHLTDNSYNRLEQRLFIEDMQVCYLVFLAIAIKQLAITTY